MTLIAAWYRTKYTTLMRVSIHFICAERVSEETRRKSFKRKRGGCSVHVKMVFVYRNNRVNNIW